MSPMAESRTACRKTVMPGKLLRIVSSSLGQPASVWASGLGSATFAGLDRELGEPRLDRTDLPDRHLCAGPAVVDLWVEWRHRLRWLRRGHPSPDFLERRRARHSSRRLFVPAEPGTNRGPSARRLCAHRLGQRSALAVSRLAACRSASRCRPGGNRSELYPPHVRLAATGGVLLCLPGTGAAAPAVAWGRIRLAGPSAEC